MALVVGTNAYITVNEAATYFGDSLRKATWSAFAGSVRSAAIVEATRYLERLDWKGEKTGGSGQTLKWPRSGVENSEGETLDSGSVPQEIKDACAEIAIRLAADPTLIDSFSTQGQDNIKSVQAGSVKTEFFITDRSSLTSPLFDWVNALVGQFLAGSDGITVGGTVSGSGDRESYFADGTADVFGRSDGFA